jgi:hypothetical protein
MVYKTKSVLIARYPRKDNNEFKTALIKLFSVNDPHKTKELPTKTFEYENIEKIIIKNNDINYFLEGNDLVINDLTQIDIEKKENLVEIS